MSIVRYRMVSLSLVIEVLPLIRKGRESAKSPTPYAGPNRFRFEGLGSAHSQHPTMLPCRCPRS